ncbi:hypothetical protein RQP46_004358 [Phenoliferia psychrophenolica]
MGDFANIILWGILASATGDFFRGTQWRTSDWRLRPVVTVVLTLCTLFTATCIYDVWDYGARDPTTNPYDKTLPQSLFQPLVHAIIGVIVQCVMSYRASKTLGTGWRRWLFLGTLGVLITVELLAGIFTTAYLTKFRGLGTGTRLLGMSWPEGVAIWMMLQLGIDLIITTSYLLILKGIVGWGSSGAESFLGIVVRLTLQSALLPTLFNIAAAIALFLTPPGDSPNENVSWAFLLPQPALYGLTILATLSIAQKTLQHAKDHDAYLQNISNPYDVPLPRRRRFEGQLAPELAAD